MVILASIIGILLLAVIVCSVVLNLLEDRDPDLRANNIDRSLGKDATFYERYIKRAFDIVIALVCSVLSAPIVLVMAILIMIEDPGSSIFAQKRVGTNGSYFKIHKLRSMRKNTGDIPTHLLGDDKQKLILRIGRFIRKTSIDELPQFIDILRGRMSFVGPRPALWNQDDLIAERDKYSANSVKPGLTGWAQINGRDTISIEDKASLDGVYVAVMRKSQFSGMGMDLKCILYTVKSVVKAEDVVEGGTGSMKV